MKKILSVLVLSFTLLSSAFSQNPVKPDSTFVDSSSLSINITLKAKHHFYSIGLMEGVQSDLRKANYIGQIAKQVTSLYDTSQLITVSVQAGLVKDLYVEIGTRQERLTTINNGEIKEALKPQLMTSQVGFWILGQLISVDTKNSILISQVIDRGKQFVSQFKQ